MTIAAEPETSYGEQAVLEHYLELSKQVKQTDINVILKDETDYISLTDMTSGFNEGSGLIGKWITNKNTLKYLGTWSGLTISISITPNSG